MTTQLNPVKKPQLTKEKVSILEKKPSNKSSRQSWGIRAKLICFATIFSVIPVLIVGGIAFNVANKSIFKQISSEKINEAEQISNQLNLFLQEQLANVTSFAKVTQNLTNKIQNLDSKAEDYQEQKSKYENELVALLTSLKRSYNLYSNLALYNLEGKQIYQAQGSESEVNQKSFAYFQQVINSGIPTISEPIITNSAGYDQYSVFISAPVKNSTGKMTAVIIGKIPVYFLGNAILGTHSSQNATSYRLIDSSGNVVYRFADPEFTPIGSKVAEKIPNFPEMNIKRENIFWEDKIDNKGQLHVYVPFNYVPQRRVGYLNWSIIGSTDEAIAFEPQKKLLQAIALGTIATAVFAAAISSLLANRSIKPLLEATSAVEKLGKGLLNTRIKPRGKDELAVLAININHMAEQIQQLLETQQENTQKLISQNNILSKLARTEDLMQGNTKAAAELVTATTAESLNIERVSVWLYNTNRDELNCLDLYEMSSRKHTEGLQLKKVNFPNFFTALQEERPILANDAYSHLATQDFAKTYLHPLGIKSILSVPILTTSGIIGVITCEQVGRQKEWEGSEVSFLNSVSNLIGLASESQFLQNEIENLLLTVSAVEDGDLTTRAKVSERTTGLVADTFNRLLEQIAQVLAQVLATVQTVSQGASSLDNLALIVAQGSSQQADEVKQVLNLASLAETSAFQSFQQIALANQSLEKATEAVTQGQVVIDTINQDIQVLNQGTHRMVQQMKTLGEFVGLADQFVHDQNQIVSQTQILALNATLVAARASQQKDPRKFSQIAREFEAIAEQISSLSQKTNDELVSLRQKTDQINNVVSVINGEVQNLGGLVNGFTQGVEQSYQVFNNVASTTQEVAQLGEVVGQSSQEIVDASQLTALKMNDIAQTASQTAQLTQLARQQSEQMQNLLENLLKTISFFRLPPEIIAQNEMQQRVDLSQIPDPTINVITASPSEQPNYTTSLQASNV